jgi:hypothetical protein
MKPWMWLVVLLALVLAVFNVDPIGAIVVKVFGQGSKQWVINLIIIAAIVYVVVRKKP